MQKEKLRWFIGISIEYNPNTLCYTHTIVTYHFIIWQNKKEKKKLKIISSFACDDHLLQKLFSVFLNYIDRIGRSKYLKTTCVVLEFRFRKSNALRFQWGISDWKIIFALNMTFHGNFSFFFLPEIYLKEGLKQIIFYTSFC